MITNKAKYKAKVLVFWEKHGLGAALDAFPQKRSTLFLWKKQLRKGSGKLESLNEKSHVPIIKRKRLWPLEIINEIKHLRQDHPNLGKDKVHVFLKTFCEKHDLEHPSASTIGRLIKDCGGSRIFPHKVSHFGKIKQIKRAKKFRKPKGFKAEYPGHLCAIDTIEKLICGLRRYVITFTDTYSRFTFAWAAKSKSSKAAKEFFDYVRLVFPYPIRHILTDNGSEFAKHFAEELRKLCIMHYHIYPRRPQDNPYAERYNGVIQQEYIDYHLSELHDLGIFNQGL